MLRWPVEPMRASAVRKLSDLPRVADPRIELKWDGWRCLAWVGRDGVELQSRSGRRLSPYFPDVCRALAERVPAGVLLDGELLAWDTAKNRTSFTHLQKRITAGRGLAKEVAARPAHLVLFDVLRDNRGRSLLNEPLHARRRRLERLLQSAPPSLALCPQTDDLDVADAWFNDYVNAGVEGLVVKAAASRYVPGKAGWVKVKSRMSTELVVGGLTGALTVPSSLLLGRYDAGGTLRHVAQTVPLTASQRREVSGLINPMAFQGSGSGHPWPVPLPAAWSRELTDRKPVPYTQVEPELVVEVEVDVAQDGPVGRFRHLVKMLRVRADLDASEVTL